MYALDTGSAFQGFGKSEIFRKSIVKASSVVMNIPAARSMVDFDYAACSNLMLYPLNPIRRRTRFRTPITRPVGT